MKLKVSIIGVVFCFLTSCLVYAGESSVTIAPPPITHPYFEKILRSQNVDYALVSVSNDVFSAAGFGVTYKQRFVVNSFLALDFSIGGFGMGGNFKDDSDMDGNLAFMNVPASFNLEVQPYANRNFNVILFAGPVFEISENRTEITIMDDDVTVMGGQTLTGGQVGIQLGIKTGGFMVSPYAYFSSKDGTERQEIEGMGEDSYRSYDLEEPITSTTVGFDIEHLSSGLTLSSLIQMAQMNEDNGDEDTSMVVLMLGWHW